MVSCMYNMCTSIYTKFLYGWCLLLFILVSDDVMKTIPIPKFDRIRVRVSQYLHDRFYYITNLSVLHKTRKVRGDIKRFTVVENPGFSLSRNSHRWRLQWNHFCLNYAMLTTSFGTCDVTMLGKISRDFLQCVTSLISLSNLLLHIPHSKTVWWNANL